MSPRPPAARRLAGLAAIVALAAGSGGAFAAGADGDAATPGPVVVELFTSQGCSSCPPADRLLARLGSRPDVVALAFHVDSWNHVGWTDPFSDAAWTRRHEAYERLMANGRYTPQVVVAGATEVLGSDENALAAAIRAAAARPRAAIALAPTPAESSVARARATVELPEALLGRKLELWLAVTENGLVTPVKKGENGGKRLEDEFVVRRFERAAKLDRGTRASSQWDVVAALEPEWKRPESRLAVFLQDPKTLEIVGAASISLAPAEAR